MKPFVRVLVGLIAFAAVCSPALAIEAGTCSKIFAYGSDGVPVKYQGKTLSRCHGLLLHFQESCLNTINGYGRAWAEVSSFKNKTSSKSEAKLADIMKLQTPAHSRCCSAAALVLKKEFMKTCPCHPTVTPHLNAYEEDFMQMMSKHISKSCSLKSAVTKWPTCPSGEGVKKAGSKKSISTDQSFGKRRLQGCSTYDGYNILVPCGTVYVCEAGTGKCNGDSCIYGTADVSVSTGGSCKYQCSNLDCSCFPSHATVETAEGVVKRMDSLQVGDRVKVVRPNGQVAYDDVYFFGHQIHDSALTYVKATLVDAQGVARVLELSRDHFMPVVKAGAAPTWANHYMSRGRDLKAGMVAFVHVDGQMQPGNVSLVEMVKQQGLFNPYTLSGNIVVNGVVASSHSRWILDGALDAIGATAHIPKVYQVLFAPLRVVYRMVGASNMARLGPMIADIGNFALELDVPAVLTSAPVTSAAAGMAAVLAVAGMAKWASK